MEIYSLPQKPIAFMYFWLNYCNENHFERISVAAKNIYHLFNLTSKIIKTDRPHLILLSDDIQILKQPGKRYRINYLHGEANPEIVNLF